jgi:hypothetical protein
MNTIDSITNILFTEFSKLGKPVVVTVDNNVLLIKVNNADTRILNWESMSPNSILETAKSLLLKENYKGNVLLHG